MRKAAYIAASLLLTLPLLGILYLSLTTDWGYPQLWGAHFTVRYWADFFKAGDGLLGSLSLSLGLAFFIGISATFFGFFITRFMLFQQQQSVKLLKLAYFPYLIAPVVFGAMLQYYFIRMGLSGSFFGVLLAQMIFIFPYSVLFLSSFWNDRVRQTAFQATTMGASETQVNRHVLLPMARPWLFICFVQCFLISWFEYGITRVIGVGKVDTLTIQVMMFVNEANPHLAALAACILVIPVLLLLAINKKIFLKRSSAD